MKESRKAYQKKGDTKPNGGKQIDCLDEKLIIANYPDSLRLNEEQK